MTNPRLIGKRLTKAAQDGKATLIEGDVIQNVGKGWARQLEIGMRAANEERVVRPGQ